MNPNVAPTVRQEISTLQRELDAKKALLANLERNCRHDWPPPEYVPIYKEAYRIPGDPPGTMGVDWRGPIDVPAETIPRWRRTCRVCKRVEETTRAITEPNPKKIPLF